MTIHNGEDSLVWCEVDLLRRNRDYIFHFNLGITHALNEEYDLAINHLITASNVFPSCVNAFKYIGLAFQKLDKHLEAISYLNRYTSFLPSDHEAIVWLAISYEQMGQLEQATACLRQCLKQDPSNYKACNNIAKIYRKQLLYRESITYYKKALSIKPDYEIALNNLGLLYEEIGNPCAAVRLYYRALDIDPCNPSTIANISRIDLLYGNYHHGLERYESRLLINDCASFLEFTPDLPRFSGSFLTGSSSILIVSEQGLGDTLQFVRYVLRLRELGVDYRLCVPNKLQSIIASSGLDVSPLDKESARDVKCSTWLPLLSLPRLLGVNPDNPIISSPYLSVNPVLVDNWRGKIRLTSDFVVAVNWQGNPESESGPSRGRSFPLNSLAPLSSIPGICFLSVQKGHGSEQMDACSFKGKFVPAQHEIDDVWDFCSIAAILSNVDVVITSDTALAHLAGGLGIRVFLLLKKLPEWRWGLHGDYTFWYPSIRIYRQVKRGSWVEPINRIKEDLTVLSSPSGLSNRSYTSME